MEGIMKMNLDIGFLDSPPTGGEEGPVFTLHDNQSDKMSTFEQERVDIMTMEPSADDNEEDDLASQTDDDHSSGSTQPSSR